MLNQGQGTYPQLAGSFYNSAQMMPHDNGRNAQQVPTFFGGLQTMMSANTAMQNYQGMPLSQNILNTQALASTRYNNALPGIIGGVGQGLGIASTIGSIGMMAGMGGSLAAGLAAPPLLIAGLMAAATGSAYKKRMAQVTDMQNALQGSRLGYGLADPVTGTISNQAAFQLSDQLKYAAAGSGFQSKDMTKVLGQASGMGMLNGMQSLSDVTKRVTDLAKASREIVMLGEGISMTDAMQLQKLTQDMGISTAKFKGMNLGKNLVMAARAAGMSMDHAAQIGGQGAVTFQQLGLGAASGMNAAFFSNIAAKGLTGVGAFSQRQLAALGGEQGIAQNLLAGQASTMGRLSETLVMGSAKLSSDGTFRIDRDLLDRYVRGEVTREDLVQRGKDIGKGMSKGDRSKLLEHLSQSMPELREELTDSLNSEEMMAIQGREILNIKNKNNISMRRAAQAYFGDAQQAEAFLGYAQNFRASRAEADRQRTIADQERMYKYAGMAKSSSMVSRIGRGFVHGVEAVGDAIMHIPNELGNYFAEQTVQFQDQRARGLRRILGVEGRISSVGVGDLGATVYGGDAPRGRSLLTYDREGLTHTARNRSLIGGQYSSYADMVSGELNVRDDLRGGALEGLLDRLNLTSGLNVLGGGGASQLLTQFEEGEYTSFRKIGDFLGIEDFRDNSIEKLEKLARIADDSIRMGRARNNTGFNYRDDRQRSAYERVVSHLRRVSLEAAKGRGEGKHGGVQAGEIGFGRLAEVSGLTGADAEAVVGQALRGFQTMEGEVGKGFNKMMAAYSDVAGIMNIQQEEQREKLDTLRLRGGGTIKGTGLSRALAESEISLSQNDLSKLVNVIANSEAAGLTLDGGDRDSTEAILRQAGISRTRYKGRGMAGVQRVINVLKDAQITSKVGGKTTTVNLSDAFRQGITRLNLAQGTAKGSAQMDILSRLEALDDEMAGLFGEGAKFLREDMQDALTLDRGSRRDRERAYRHAFEQDVKPEDEKVSLIVDVLKERAQKQLDSRLAKKDREIYHSERSLKAARMVGGDRLTKAEQFHAMKLKEREAIEKRYAVDEGTLREKAMSALFRQYKDNVGDDEVFERYDKDTASLLDLGKTTLKETLDSLAVRGGKDDTDRRQRREAYSKLMEGSLGADLEVEFRNMRSRLTGVTDQNERRRVESQFMEKVFKKARDAKVELPGQEKAKSLPKILSEISEGIDQFKKTMQSVAKITNNNGTLEIKLPNP